MWPLLAGPNPSLLGARIDCDCLEVDVTRMDGGMKLVSTIILVILIFLAVASGITKITLMQQDVEFFGKYGFSNPILIAYGAIQLVGGVLLVPKKTRFVGAAVVAITFLISLVVLLMDGNIPVSLATLVATLLLGVVMKQSWSATASAS